MNHFFPKLILICSFFWITFSNYAQQSKLQVKGEQLLKKEKYEEAIAYFSTLDSATATQDPLYHYYYGMSYYYSPNQKEDAIPHLLDYLQAVNPTQLDYYGHQHVYYVLGKLYHLTYKFKEAKQYYNIYIDLVQGNTSMTIEEKEKKVQEVRREIEQCKFAEVAFNNPRNVVIENLGDSVNSIYPEYAPVVSQDEKLLIYTSRRPDTQGKKRIPNEGYYEDIYKAQMTKGSLFEAKSHIPDSSKGYYFSLVTDFSYDKALNLGSKINSKGHDGSIQLGAHDSVLYFYRDSDIWSINMQDSTVEKPTKLDVFINSDEHEPSLFFSYDGQKLFIVSDRPGGFGGLDIYMSLKNGNGEWSEPKNLGDKINTPFDEDAPYFDPNGKTFYFASRGHSSIGEFDIFRSTLTDTSWSKPVNMGYPINTPSDDIYFTMTSRYNRGYYSSGRLEGHGDMDLYRITFADERDPIAELVGYVKQGDQLVPAKSKITMKSLVSDESINQETDTIEGDYFLLLGHGKKYEMTVETQNFAPYKKVFDIPEQKEYFQLYQEVHHVYLYNENGDIIGQKITVYNAIGGADSSLTYYDENTLAKFLLLKKNLTKDFDIKALTDFQADSLAKLMESFEPIDFKNGFDFKSLNGMQIDSLLNKIEENLAYHYQDYYNSSTDVKFYLTEEELMAQMKNDTTLNYDFNDNTTVATLNSSNADVTKLDSYTDYTKSLDRDELFKEEKLNDVPSDFAVAMDVKNIKGLFYTVQIGVYKNPVTPQILLNITPLNIQKTDKGNLRYTTGVFVDIPNAQVRMEEIIKMGVTDAYITAYYNGERITITESKRLIEEEGVKVLFNSDANMILNKR